MGARSKRKGARVERELVDLHRGLGVAAQRIPLSGAAGGMFGGDIEIEGIGRAEVKARGNGGGFVQLERWLADHAALFLRRDHADPLVVLPWSTWARLLARGKVA